jgi:hypothetical protein
MRLTTKLLAVTVLVFLFFGFSMLLSFFRGESFCFGEPKDSNNDGVYENCIVTN